LTKSFSFTFYSKTIAVSLLLLCLNNVNAQIFLETFDEGNTATSGADDIGGVTWTSTCLTCIPPGDYWEIVNGKFESQDTNGPAVWETNADIDISGCDFIEITVDLEEDDDLEGCGTGCNSVDFVQLEYNLDNTGWQSPTNSTFCAGPCADVNVIQSDDIVGGGPITYSTGCAIGPASTLRIRITVQTWAGTEKWIIDNVAVNCGNSNIDAGPDVLTCNGAPVTLTALNTSGGTLAWSFGITNGLPFTGTVGSNYFTITETMGACSSQDSTLVTVTPGPLFTVVSSPSSSCTPPFDGIITIAGLTPGFTYDLTYQDGGGTVGPTSLVANGSGQIVLINLPPDFYTNFIIDSLGCIEVNTTGVVVDPPIVPTVDAGIDQTICEGNQVTLTAFNPDAGALTWDNSVTDGVPFSPTAGTIMYHVTTNISGCTATDSVQVTVFTIPTVNVPAQGPFAIGSGIQTLTSSTAGGTWSATCGACIDPSTGDFDPLLAGIGQHTVCYTAGTAPCEDSMCVFIFVNDGCALVGSITSNNPTCYQFNDGSATINIQFEVGNVVFVITDSAGTVLNVGNSNTANNLSEGWYYFTVSDDFPCTFVDSVFLNDPGEMSVGFLVTPPSCYGLLDGMAVADTVFNYTGNYNQISYIWTPNSGSNGLGEDTLFNAGGDGYVLIVTDENGCSAQIDFNVTFPDSLYLVEFSSQPAYCRVFGYQVGNGVVAGAASGGTPDYTYEWVNLTDPDTINITTWGGLNPGLYQFTAIDNNGCVIIDTIMVDSLNPVADFTMSSPQFTAEWEGTAPVDVNFVNNSLYFANPNNPQADTTFFWNFGTGNWILSQDLFEQFDTTYLSSGVYTVCLVALNKNGCSDTLCVPITIYDLESFVPINIFTPNDDGANDVFSFINLSSAIVEFKCVIVNRWGRTIAELNDISETWNGTDKSGSLCVDGVYFYTYFGRAQNGETIEGQGNVQLIR
jgi:gliding motility-associated-like protein